MLTPTDIRFTDTMILNGGTFILVEVLPIYESNEEGEEERQSGTSVIVALSAHRLEKIEVVIEASIPSSPFQDLVLAEVTFSQFEGRFIRQGADYVFTATASHLQLV